MATIEEQIIGIAKDGKFVESDKNGFLKFYDPPKGEKIKIKIINNYSLENLFLKEEIKKNKIRCPICEQIEEKNKISRFKLLDIE